MMRSESVVVDSVARRSNNCSGAGSAAPRSTKFCAVYDVYVTTYYSDILANQSTPPATYYSDLLAEQSRAIGGACRQESGDEKKHVRAWQTSHERKHKITRLNNSLRKVVHGFCT